MAVCPSWQGSTSIGWVSGGWTENGSGVYAEGLHDLGA